MKKVLLAVTMSISALASLTNTASLTSDYVWRGQTQTSHNAAVQGSFDYEHSSGIYGGLWLSNTSGNGSESNISLGYKKIFGELSVSLGGLMYHYIQNGSADTMEYNFGLGHSGYDFSVNYVDDHFGSDVSSYYLSLSKSFYFTSKDFGLNLALGYTSYDDEAKKGEKNHIDYKVGLVKKYKYNDVEVWYTDTNRKTLSSSAETEQEDKVLGVSIHVNL